MGCNTSQSNELISPTDKQATKKPKVYAGTFFQIQTSKFQSAYYIAELIGENLTSEIRSCYHKTTQKKRAVKVIRKHTKGAKRSEIMREIDVLKKLDHPNIVRLQQLYEDDKRFYIVTEAMRGRGLFDEILQKGRFSEVDAACITYQMLSALNYLHQNNIVHRDLKPESILLEAETLHLTLYDFGSATYLNSEHRFSEVVGSTYYIAPEVLLEAETYNEKCDIWSCGVLLFILISGQAPYDGKTEGEVKARICKGNYTMNAPIWEKASAEVKDLIKSLLTFAAVERPTAAQALDHPWMTAYRANTIAETQLTSILSSLQNFRNSIKLKDAVCTFISTLMLTSQETEEMREAFRALDKNHDGKLSKQELLDEYSILKGQEEATQEVDRVFDLVDTDKSGYIDYSEFIKATVDHSKMLSAANLESAFSMFDTDGSGCITKEELSRLLGANYDDDEWNRILEEVDSDRNGGLDIKEFKELLLNRYR
mmetsp:Transcript_4797/g.8947  ORF Transcript_4797/g.8947 Transcript_4797/m.8947 type:complete len:483 (-) Transcript_4797:657-2105(-)